MKAAGTWATQALSERLQEIFWALVDDEMYFVENETASDAIDAILDDHRDDSGKIDTLALENTFTDLLDICRHKED